MSWVKAIVDAAMQSKNRNAKTPVAPSPKDDYVAPPIYTPARRTEVSMDHLLAREAPIKIPERTSPEKRTNWDTFEWEPPKPEKEWVPNWEMPEPWSEKKWNSGYSLDPSHSSNLLINSPEFSQPWEWRETRTGIEDPWGIPERRDDVRIQPIERRRDEARIQPVPYRDDDIVWTGGSKDFDERTGTYRPGHRDEKVSEPNWWERDPKESVYSREPRRARDDRRPRWAPRDEVLIQPIERERRQRPFRRDDREPRWVPRPGPNSLPSDEKRYELLTGGKSRRNLPSNEERYELLTGRKRRSPVIIRPTQDLNYDDLDRKYDRYRR